MKPVLELYIDMFDGVKAWRIEWPVLPLDIVFPKIICNHRWFVYWSIVLLADGIP
jgi:hypothetical protein